MKASYQLFFFGSILLLASCNDVLIREPRVRNDVNGDGIADIIASADDSASSILKLYYKPVLNTKCPLSLKRTFCIYFIALPDLPELSPIHNLCPFRIYQGFLPY